MREKRCWKIAGLIYALILMAVAVSVRTSFAQTRMKGQGSHFYPGEIIIKFTEQAFRSLATKAERGIALTAVPSIDNLNRKYGVYAIEAFVNDGEQGYKAAEDPYGLARIFVLRVPKEADTDSIVEAFQKDSHIEFAELSGYAVMDDQVPRENPGFDAAHELNYRSPELNTNELNANAVNADSKSKHRTGTDTASEDAPVADAARKDAGWADIACEDAVQADAASEDAVQADAMGSDCMPIPYPSPNSDTGFSAADNFFRPSDRYYLAGYPNNQWGLDRINWSWPMVRAVTPAGSLAPQIIAIVDTGIDYKHPDLRDKVLVDRGYDFVDMDADPMDTNGHGTAVAGIAAAVTNNLIGIAGTAPNSLLLPVRVLEGGPQESGPAQLMAGLLRVARGIRYAADNGAQVINLSLSWTDPSLVVSSALNYAYRVRKCIIVAAAGNDNRSSVSMPAAHPACIAVGAIDRSDTRVDYDTAHGSNYGTGLEVVAPGDYMLTLNTVRNGLYTPAVVLYSLRDGTVAYNWGTSYAAPFVSGLASILSTQHPFAGNEAIRKHIADTCDSLGDATEYGVGLINVTKALLNPL
ncbi:MAG: S8 family serine peptidase [bacterium]